MTRMLRPTDLELLPVPAGVGADTVLLGMPHLSMNGLSEGWLLKELGHRHWMMLAGAAGRAAPDFRDLNGAPVYAAFCAVSITGGDFASVGENDRLTIRSGLGRLSRTQMASRHRLGIAGRPIGAVEMVSTFVRRSETGGNHAVARVAVDGLPLVGAPAPAEQLAAAAAGLRAGRLGAHMGFALAGEGELARFRFDPCPAQDFNGAGFLYFSSFVGFVDRAEWGFDPAAARHATTISRDVFYRGNVDPGESVEVAVVAAHRGDGTFSHHCRLERAGDRLPLAEVFTVRAARD